MLTACSGGSAASARGARGQCIVVVPDRKAVTVTLCVTATDFPMSNEDIESLIDNLILPAIR